MALQTQSVLLVPSSALTLIQNLAATTKTQAQSVLNTVQTTSISTDFVFSMINGLTSFINSVTTWKAVSGLDAYATSQGYSGTLSADCTTAINAATAVITNMVSTFPKEADGWLMAYKINADGSRVPNTFAPAVTGGLQSALQSFIATIS